MSQKFKSDIELQAGLRDSSGVLGTSGQVLSSTGSQVSWINQTTTANDVENLVKAGVAINKGQAVYVTGADGTNIIVGLASNATEATSSKTLGLLNATVAINGMANVVQIGRLDGLNTLGATAGDPVWLGTGGNLIYGLINKPYAPANLVFIGVVTRVNVSNGEIFINVQNGFELNELHDVDLKTTVPINGDILGYNGTLWVNKTIAGWLGYTPANASGTTNYVSKFTGATTLGNSLIYDNGTNVGIGTTSPGVRFVNTGAPLADNPTLGSGTIGANAILSANGLYGLYTGVGSNGDVWQQVQRNDANTSVYNLLLQPSGGNVGIGTTSPSTKLEVVGNIKSSLSGYEFQIYPAFDTNVVGMGASSNHNLAIVTNATERMRITSGGNVGIGTTNPTEKLHVAGVAQILDDGSRGRITFQISSTQNDLYSTTTAFDDYRNLRLSSNELILSSGGTTERMRITSAGNVGIGTTSPNSILSIGSTDSTAVLTSGGGNTHLSLKAMGSQGELIFGSGGVSNGVVGTERMRITSAGNVGIGTTSPSAKLEVLSAVSATPITNGVVRVVGTGTNPATGSGGGLLLAQQDSGGNYVNYASITGRRVNNAANNIVDLDFNTGSPSDSIALATRMTIAGNSGNVGIGTTSPASKLNVSGDNITVSAGYGLAWSGDTSRIMTPEDNVSGALIQTPGIIRFNPGSSEKMRIASSGYVGIGTTNPQRKLDVVGSHTTSTFRVYYPDLNVAGQDASVDIWASEPGVSYNGSGIGSNVNGHPYYGRTNTSLGQAFLRFINGNMMFHTSTGDALNAERMRIDSAGNVGIGTSSPNRLLTVAGTTSGLIALNASSYRNTTIGSDSTGNFIVYDDNAGAYRMVINSAGDVAVGTTAALLNTSGRGNITINGSSESILTLATGGTWRSYFFTTGGNTLLGAANEMTFGTNGGTERMRITSGGRVGIGTTTPYSILDAQDYTSFLSLSSTINSEATTDNQQIGGIDFRKHYSLAIGASIRQLQAGGTSNYSNAHLAFYTNNGSVAFGSVPPERMRITDSGNVGIGTTSPNNKLDVNGNINVPSTNFYRYDGDTGLIGSATTIVGGASNQLGIRASNDILFATNGANERMRITSGGNVGIGTTNPAYKLDVSSSNSSILKLYNTESNYGANQSKIDFFGKWWSGDPSSENIQASIVGEHVSGDGYRRGALKFYTNSDGTLINPMTINHDGNVGIGTTSPGAKLDVAGDALINGLTVGRGGGNSAFNTALGVGALSSNTSGEYNIAIGRSANTSNNISGSTVIGPDLFTNPSGVSGLTSNSIAISQYNPDFAGTQYPHFYAPDKIQCPNSGAVTDILSIDYGIYTAAFIEYSLFNSDGDQFRAGTYTIAFKLSGTPVDIDDQTVVYSGTTLLANFIGSQSGSVHTIQLRNDDSDTYNIRITARLLMR